MIHKIIFCCLFLIVTVPTYATGKTGKGPDDIAHSGDASVPEIEQFVNLQLQLEEIGDKNHLYDLTENERNETVHKLLQDPSVRNTIMKCEIFLKKPSCNYSIYRSYDGTCNNLKHPLWGSSLYKQTRLLPAYYNGQYELRKSATSEELPSPRNISLKLKHDSPKTSTVSALFTFWGQMMAHDVSLSLSLTINKSVPDCCEPSKKNHPQYCSPIEIDKDDYFYSKFDETCLSFVRSVIYPTCSFERRSPMNKKTSFLDLSSVYGDNDKEAWHARKNDGSGKLKYKVSRHGDLMPIAKEEKGFCLKHKPQLCFDGADGRVNQHTMLTILHTLYVRMHNLIVGHLQELNPQWDEEKLYQEGRRINIAIYQYTIYREYLPLLLGQCLVDIFELGVEFEKGSQYDDSINPSEDVEFSTAALRLHSMIPTKINDRTPPYEMRDSFDFTKPVFDGKTTALLLAGTCEVPSLQNDINVVEDMTNFMYKPHGADFGNDISSFNIQRGRDHGLPPYIILVKYCWDIDIESFCDLNKLMTQENVDLLERTYSHVQDIDLWIGLIMEQPEQNSVVGPTASCILSNQFRKLKFGDNFFVSHKNSRHIFTDGQKAFIESFTFAKFLCKTSNLTEVRVHPMMVLSEKNPLISCDSFPAIDWAQWKE